MKSVCYFGLYPYMVSCLFQGFSFPSVCARSRTLLDKMIPQETLVQAGASVWTGGGVYSGSDVGV